MFRHILLSALLLLLVSAGAWADSFKLSDVQLEGNDRVDGASVRAVVTLGPGKEATLADVDRDLKAIFALGYFDDVKADLREDGGGKILVFIVHERPLVREVRFDGIDKLGDDKLRPLVTLKVPTIYDPLKIRESIKAMLDLYREEGYHAAKIEPQLNTDERNECLLTFKVDEGEKVLIDEIVFEGNKVIDSDELLDTMKTRPRWIFSWITGRGTYKPGEIELDLDLLHALYYDRGYMDAKIKQPQIGLVKKDKYMKLLFEVDEGKEYRTGKISINGDLLKSREELLKLVTLREGEPFSRTKLRESVLALTDLYADEGYANVNVVPFTGKNPDVLTIDLRLDVEQGSLVHIENIRIRGNTVTRDKVLRRELSLIEGDKFSATKIRESRNHLLNLGFFEEINVATSPGSAPDLNNLDIEVTEKPTGSFSIGMGYSSVDNFIFQGSIKQANFLGYGVSVDASATLGGSSQLFRIGATDPYFLDSKWMAGLDIYKSEREYSDFSERATGGSVKVGHPLTKYSRFSLAYRYEEKSIYDVADSVTSPIIVEGDSTLSSVTATLSRNSTDYRFDPTRGAVSSLTTEYAGLGGTDRFAKVQASHRHFFGLFWGTVLSLNGNVGYVFQTTGDQIPVGERFFPGGLRSIRGFRTREVGPQDGDTYIGGEKQAFFNADFLFPINKKLGLKGLLFADTGNAWRENENYFSDMRYSVGYGIRWFSPLGPLRFEWGYNLDSRAGEKDSVFEFSIGSYF